MRGRVGVGLIFVWRQDACKRVQAIGIHQAWCTINWTRWLWDLGPLGAQTKNELVGLRQSRPTRAGFREKETESVQAQGSRDVLNLSISLSKKKRNKSPFLSPPFPILAAAVLPKTRHRRDHQTFVASPITSFSSSSTQETTWYDLPLIHLSRF
jgi:hypothetical protein